MKFAWALDHAIPDSVERELVAFADKAGLDSIWTMENHHLRDGVTTAAVTLERTRRIKVVMGTLSPSFRHPVEIGLTLANLERMFPGRVALNLGSGMAETLVRLGVAVDHPLGRLRETIAIIQRFFTGANFSYHGDHYQIEKHRLSGDPLDLPPIFISAMGPNLISLAGEVADGINLPLASSPEYVAQSVQRFNESSAAAGRDRSRQTIVAEVLVQVGQRGGNLSGIRKLLGFHYSSKHFEKVAAPSGLVLDHAAIKEAFVGRHLERLDDLLPDDVVHTFAAVGTADAVLTRLQQYWETGPDLINLYTAGTAEDRVRTMHALFPAVHV
jgi:5,10-methylenetetrahydromethanopterin reductase